MTDANPTDLIHARFHAAAIAELLSAAYWQRGPRDENYREYLVEKALAEFQELTTAMEGVKAFLNKPSSDPADLQAA